LISLLASSRRFILYLAILSVLVIQQKETPSALWVKQERELVSYQGIQEIDSMPRGSRVMYFNFDNWAGDAYLISLSGLQFESYTGHLIGQEQFKTQTYMPSESFSSRSFYTDEKNALCVGQRILGNSGQIRTRDIDLKSKLLEWCGEGPFPRVVLYSSD
jgi:hypothetical protein